MKYKLLLGSYIDSVNAQDINCFHIANHINKNEFEVHAFCHSNDVKIRGVTFHKVSNNRFFKNIQKLLTMISLKADIYYLPRVEKVDIIFAWLTKRHVVSSVEIQTVYLKNNYYRFFNRYIDGYFCISEFLKKLNKKCWNKNVPVIYLGIDYLGKPVEHEKLNKIIWVGSVCERKRPKLFLELAQHHKNLDFCMVGDGEELQIVKKMAQNNNMKNISFEGKLSNEQTLTKIQSADLLCITSKEEGLPKIVLEAASKGVPTIYINEMYSVDYIKNGVNGFGVKNIEEMEKKIDLLVRDVQLYKKLSVEVGKLANQYSWERLISQYETFFKDFCK